MIYASRAGYEVYENQGGGITIAVIEDFDGPPGILAIPKDAELLRLIIAGLSAAVRDIESPRNT